MNRSMFTSSALVTEMNDQIVYAQEEEFTPDFVRDFK